MQIGHPHLCRPRSRNPEEGGSPPRCPQHVVCVDESVRRPSHLWLLGVCFRRYRDHVRMTFRYHHRHRRHLQFRFLAENQTQGRQIEVYLCLVHRLGRFGNGTQFEIVVEVLGGYCYCLPGWPSKHCQCLHFHRSSLVLVEQVGLPVRPKHAVQQQFSSDHDLGR